MSKQRSQQQQLPYHRSAIILLGELLRTIAPSAAHHIVGAPHPIKRRKLSLRPSLSIAQPIYKMTAAIMRINVPDPIFLSAA